MGELDHPWLPRSEADATRVPDLGRLLRDYRTAESLTQGQLGKLLGVDQTYISKIERGHRVIRDMGFLLNVSRILRVTPELLGLAGDGFQGEAVPQDAVAASQERWRAGRRYLNQHRAELARQASLLYPSDVRLKSTALIAPREWLPDEPVRLEEIELEWVDGSMPRGIDGTEPESQQVRPLRALGRQFESYTSAVRYLDPPKLFENRPSYRLTDVHWAQSGGRMCFGLANYFDKLDVSEAVGHELALVQMENTDKKVTRLPELPFRSLIGDPFAFGRRAMIPAITTLTLRRRRTHGDASFLLHWRDPRRVATASGLYDVIPAGEFQPSSMAPWDRSNDFDLWRNVVRELSEELLGTPEHDGSRSTPIDYDAWPLYRDLQRGRVNGQVSIYCLGVALDSLTLATTILTALVIDDDLFDRIFADIVHANAEGITVSAVDGMAGGKGIPFSEGNVGRLLRKEPMASPGAGCLALAWRHRGLLLTS
ncbi:helix-turn-helix transcriptional regulator [Sphaerisporangium sp. NPDC005288]|uniref:helix-turn-helix domain-containing protein n=1 Tax=Sphaerisporangium sp. NPDC005288 TaxID=3155114 RepID=UPI0033BC604C